MYSRKKKKGGASLNVFGRKATKFVFSLNKRPQMWLQSYRQPLAPTIKLLAVTAAGRVQENSGLIFAPVIGSKPVAFQSSSLPAPLLFLLRAPRRSGFFPPLSESSSKISQFLEGILWSFSRRKALVSSTFICISSFVFISKKSVHWMF